VRLRELFLPLLGNWTGIEQQAASLWAPATSARAMIVFKLDVGAQVVLQDYRQVRADAEEFSGHGVFMIDNADVISPATPTPILWWFFDSYGYPPQPAHGGWQNDELIMQKRRHKVWPSIISQLLTISSATGFGYDSMTTPRWRTF
jgi:hypothetical protein